MPAKCIVLSSTSSAARISLALLLTALLVSPDLALAQEPAACTGNSYWTASGVTLPTPIETFGAAVSPTANGDVMYIIGGYENPATGTAGFQKQVYHKLVSGVIQGSGTWFQNSLWKDPLSPTEVVGLSRDLCGVVNNGYLYTVGGVYFDSKTDQTYGNSTNRVWYASINPTTGNLGSWKQTTAITLPQGVTGLQLHGAVALNNYLYVIGGSTAAHGDGTVSQHTTSAVHFSPINADGSLGAWDQGSPTPVLPPIPSMGVGLYKTCPVVVFNGSVGSIYVSGGEAAGISLNQVVYATPSPSTGLFTSWTNNSGNYMPTADGAQAVVYNNGITLMGGDEGSNTIVPDVFQGAVAADNSVTWTDNASNFLPQAISRNAGATSGGRTFSVGGQHAGIDLSCIYFH